MIQSGTDGLTVADITIKGGIVILDPIDILNDPNSTFKRDVGESFQLPPSLQSMVQSYGEIFASSDEWGKIVAKVYANNGEITYKKLPNGKYEAEIQYGEWLNFLSKIPNECREIHNNVNFDFVDDAVAVYHSTESAELAIKAGKLGASIKMEPSNLFERKNFDKAYELAKAKDFLLDTESSKEIYSIARS